MSKLLNNVWFKCITTLLCIALISGGLLAVLNDVLYVSPEERTSRAIQSIYGEEKEYSVIIDDSSEKPVYEFGEINKIYKVENDLLFQATGYNGFKNGTVTLWVQVKQSDGKFDVEKVLLANFTKQTFMGKLNDAYYKGFETADVTATYSEIDATGSNGIKNIVTGASRSSTAGSNAVNSVIKWLEEN